ncbi:MAG: HEPN domain-containing protein [Chloroflexota bacterium]|nr:HEPN domain-containing protein [Chloroflexota bacterium]
MGKSHQEIALSWFAIAQRDLDSARRLAIGPNSYLDTAIYHCQQAAEKAVKGFLVFHNRDFPKTHDIRKVVALVEAVESRFASWLDATELLTPYATAFRYTDELIEPNQDESDHPLKSADDLYTFVFSLLPPAIHPKQ